jgi:WD40 repeat protein
MKYSLFTIALLIGGALLLPRTGDGDINPSPTIVYSIQRDNVEVISWSPDGKLIALSSKENGTIEIIGSESGKTKTICTGILTNPIYPILISWSPDSSQIASFDSGYNVRIWDVTTGKSVLSLAISDVSERE